MQTIAIYGNRHQERYLDKIGRFLDSLRGFGFRLVVAPRFADYLDSVGINVNEGERSDSLPSEAVMVVSIGGDGTFLRAAQWVGRSGVPILGINTGHLGFLASYSFADLDPMLDAIRGGNFRREQRLLLKVECDSLPATVWPYALNEVAVMKSETSSMINVNAEIDGFFLADYLSDGLIISTPTGSTAYNLSVGGPILQPTLHCMALSPIAPHSLTMRPLVVDAGSSLTLRPTSRSSEFRLSIDGKSAVIPCGSTVSVSKADFMIVALRIPSDNFASILRDKLLWGKR